MSQDDQKKFRAMERLVRSLASCTKDGEDDGEGGEFIMENDDAVDTLHTFISEARDILGLPDRNDPRPECPECGTRVDEDGYCTDVGCVNVGKTVS